MQWSNFYRPVNVNDDISLLHVMLMLVVDCVIFAVVTWYVDAVRPGEFGVPQPLYFPFTVSARVSAYEYGWVRTCVYLAWWLCVRFPVATCTGRACFMRTSKYQFTCTSCSRKLYTLCKLCCAVRVRTSTIYSVFIDVTY